MRSDLKVISNSQVNGMLIEPTRRLDRRVARGISPPGALLVDAPSRVDHEIVPFTVDEARRFLAAIRGHRLEARWIVGLSLGLRQGEALGLWWDDIDLEAGTVQIRRQLERPRVPGARPSFGPLKAARSKRTLNLPAPLLAAIRDHDERCRSPGRSCRPTVKNATRPAQTGPARRSAPRDDRSGTSRPVPASTG
jgi:integrase